MVRLRFVGRIFLISLANLPFDALIEGDALELSRFIFGVGKLEWLGYNLVKVAR